MGIRGELFSKKVLLQNRSYFFNVKENRKGDLYLNIVESKNRDEGGFERQSVVLFEDDLQEFLRGFDESLRVLEKAVREKRRASPKKINYSPPESGAVPAGRITAKKFVRNGKSGGGTPKTGKAPEAHKPAKTVKTVKFIQKRDKGHMPQR
ncbi:MAG: DUF3276 family protein [Spirochaetaceae bacterium]|jgi:hypothetical protein|nr:DUF3276 family protein [Spirochaetaceae bacterium]